MELKWIFIFDCISICFNKICVRDNTDKNYRILLLLLIIVSKTKQPSFFSSNAVLLINVSRKRSLLILYYAKDALSYRDAYFVGEYSTSNSNRIK